MDYLQEYAKFQMKILTNKQALVCLFNHYDRNVLPFFDLIMISIKGKLQLELKFYYYELWIKLFLQPNFPMLQSKQIIQVNYFS